MRRRPSHQAQITGKAPASLIKRLRRLRKRFLSTSRNTVLAWASSRLGLLRRITLRRTTFIGITGSCGKTTATELIGKILSVGGPCHVKSGGNTHHTVAQSMLKMASSARFSVHEVGTHGPGTIARSARILRPQIGIVTNIGTDHYRQFRSPEATAREKAALITALPKSGTAILNADDPHVRAMATLTGARVFTYGLSPGADIRAAEIASVWPERLTLTVIYRGQHQRIRTKLIGEHWVTSILSAIACGIVCGVPLRDCVKAVEEFEPAFARWSIHTEPGKPVFILDSRKAPSWTLPMSVAFVGRAQAPRKTIVFGTISDFPGGSTSPRIRKLARQALAVADRVVFIGPNASYVNKLAADIGQRLWSFPTAYEGSEFLALSALPGELILVKASIADHLERVMLHQLDQVVCWRQRCGREMDCPECRLYRTPQAPPGGLAQSERSAPSRIALGAGQVGSEPC